MKKRHAFHRPITLLAGFLLLLSSCQPNSVENLTRIEVSSSTFAGDKKSSITIFEKGGIEHARLTEEGRIVSEVPLSATQRRSLEQFLEEFKELKEVNLCTSVDSYTLAFENGKVQKEDGSCNWNGFKKIKSVLFKV